MVAAIDNIAKLYGVNTIAEGVENERIDNEIQRIGVDYRQGYHFGHNLSFQELLNMTKSAYQHPKHPPALGTSPAFRTTKCAQWVATSYCLTA